MKADTTGSSFAHGTEVFSRAPRSLTLAKSGPGVCGPELGLDWASSHERREPASSTLALMSHPVQTAAGAASSGERKATAKVTNGTSLQVSVKPGGAGRPQMRPSTLPPRRRKDPADAGKSPPSRAQHVPFAGPNCARADGASLNRPQGRRSGSLSQAPPLRGALCSQEPGRGEPPYVPGRTQQPRLR